MSKCAVNTPEYKNLANSLNSAVAYREYTLSLMRGEEMRGTQEIMERYWNNGKYLNKKTTGGILPDVDGYRVHLNAISEYMHFNKSAEQEIINNSKKKVVNSTITTFADRLKEKLGVDYNIITINEAIELTKNLPVEFQYRQGDAGFFYQGKVYFVDDFVNLDTVFHEFAHPFIRAIRFSNKSLFSSLFSQLSQSNPELIERVKERYKGLDDESLMEEALVTALESFSSPPSSNNKFIEFIKELLYQIKKIFRKFIGKNIKIENLKSNTTLEELASLMNNDESIDIDTTYITENDIIAYKRSYEKEIEELKNLDDSKEMLSLINTTYRKVSQIVSNIKRNQNYTQYQELFADLHNRNELDQVKTLLREFRDLPVEGDIKKMHERAYSMVESINIMHNNIKKINAELAKLSKNVNNKEDISQAYYLMNILKNYKEIFDEYQSYLNTEYIPVENPLHKLISQANEQIRQAQSYIDEIYREGGSDAVYAVLQPYAEMLDRKFLSILKHYDEINAPQWVKDNKRKEYERLKITPEKIRSLIDGELGDAHMFNSFFEGYMNNQDPIVSSLALYVKNGYTDMMNRAYQKVQMFTEKIKDKLDRAGYNRNDPREFLRHLLYDDMSARRRVNKDDELESYSVRKFINPWQNYELEKAKMNYEINKAREEEDFDKLKELYEKRAKHYNEFMHAQFTPEYYNIKNSLVKDEKDTIGNKAKELLDEVDNEIQTIQKLRGMDGFLEPETLEEFDQILNKRKALFSLYDIHGNKKEGEELEISERLREYRDSKTDLYDITPNIKLFEHTFNEFLEGLESLDLTQEEINKKIEEWKDQNIIEKPTDAFYLERSAIYQRIEELREEYKRLTRLSKGDAELKIAKLYDELNGLLYEHRDQNGQPMANSMTLEKRLRIKELHEQIETEKELQLQSNGLTKSENTWLQKHYQKVQAERLGGKEVPIEDNLKARELNKRKLSFGKKALKNVSEEERSRLLQAKAIKELISAEYEKLLDLQERNVTEDYVNMFTTWLDHTRTVLIELENKSREGLSKDELDELDELYNNAKYVVNIADTLQEADLLTQKRIVSELIRDEIFMVKIIKVSNDTNGNFKKWFLDNHYKKQITEKIQDYSGVNYVQKNVWVPTNAWLKIIPSKDEHNSKTKITLRDGSTYEFNGIPVKKYDSYTISEQYRTKKVTILEALKSGDITKANYDENNETWLPRLDVPNSPYKNNRFFELQQKDPLKFEILMDMLEFHLENQENHDVKDRLGFEIPRIRARRYERVKYSGEEIDPETGEIKHSRSRLSRFIEDLKSYFKQRPDDTERDFNPDETHYSILESAFDENDDKIIIRGKYDIDVQEVSWDLFDTLITYMTSLERKNTLKELNPLARALQQTTLNTKIKNLKNIHNRKGVTATIFKLDRKNKSIRATAIENFIEREFESIYQKGFGADSQEIQTIAGAIQKLSAINMFALNFNSALKNSLGAKVQGLIEAAGGKYYNMKDFGNGVVWANKAMFELSGNIYDFKAKTLNVQIMQLFDMTTGRTEEVMGDQLRRTFLKDLVNSPSGMLTNFRKWGEQNSEVSIAAAVLFNTKIERVVNGKTTIIPYIEAWELDPETKVIRLKSGIDSKWGLNGDMFKQIKNRVAAVTNDANGAFSKFDAPEADRFFMYRALMFLRRWFMRMAINRFGASQAVWRNLWNPKNWINLEERHDVGKFDTSMGWYMRGMRATSLMLQTGMKNWDLLEAEDKQAFMRIAMDIITMVIATVLITFVLGFDPDDPDKYKKLKSRSGPLPTPFTSPSEYEFNVGGYAANHAILLLMGMRQEQLQWIPLPGFGLDDYKDYLQLQPIALTNTINTFVKFLNGLTNYAIGSESATYQREVGPYKWQQQDRLKLFNYAAKTVGFSGTQVDPTLAIKNFVSIQARKGN